MNVCLKCGAPPTPDTADTDLPMCYAHRLDGESDSGQPRDADAFDDYLTEEDLERMSTPEHERDPRDDDGMQEIRDARYGDLGL